MLLLRLILISIYCLPLRLFANPEVEMANRCLRDDDKRELSGKLLALMTTLPTPPIVPVEEAEGLRYLTSSNVFSRILGTSAHATILNDTEELRFLPYSLANTPVLLIVRSEGEWSLERARKVLSVAKMQGNTISFLWLNETAVPASFRTLAKETNGRAFGLRDLNRLVLRHVCSR